MTWRIHIWWHDAFIFDDMTHSYLIWLILVRHERIHMWHDAFICDMNAFICDMMHSYVDCGRSPRVHSRRSAGHFVLVFSYTQSYVWCDTCIWFIHILIHTCDTTHSYVWHNAFTNANAGVYEYRHAPAKQLFSIRSWLTGSASQAP